MGYVIAIAGKGGTGKTTIAALIIKLIKEEKKGSVLAVDADPNNNLAQALGMETKETIGSILEEISAHPDKIPAGMSKDRFVEYRLQLSIAEADGFDVLSMGRSEGPGCYCYVNNVLRGIVEKIIKDYDYIVVDNEAGFEHLSRRTTRKADALIVVSDSSKTGLRSAGRINEIVKELDIKTKKRLLVINQCNFDIDSSALKNLDLEYIGNIPEDKRISEISIEGDSLMNLEKNAVSIEALRKIKDKIWQKN